VLSGSVTLIHGDANDPQLQHLITRIKQQMAAEAAEATAPQDLLNAASIPTATEVAVSASGTTANVTSTATASSCHQLYDPGQCSGCATKWTLHSCFDGQCYDGLWRKLREAITVNRRQQFHRSVTGRGWAAASRAAASGAEAAGVSPAGTSLAELLGPAASAANISISAAGPGASFW
jgi:hypothetical protein